MEIEMINVESSNILRVGHSKESSTLRVEFKGGGVYDYASVTEDTFKSLVGADSVGSYFHQNIKNDYSFTKL